MPFGIVGRTGPGMRIEAVVGFGDRSTGRGTFGGEFWARHCNHAMGTYFRSDAALFPNYFGQTCLQYMASGAAGSC